MCPRSRSLDIKLVSKREKLASESCHNNVNKLSCAYAQRSSNKEINFTSLRTLFCVGKEATRSRTTDVNRCSPWATPAESFFSSALKFFPVEFIKWNTRRARNVILSLLTQSRRRKTASKDFSFSSRRFGFTKFFSSPRFSYSSESSDWRRPKRRGKKPRKIHPSSTAVI